MNTLTKISTQNDKVVVAVSDFVSLKGSLISDTSLPSNKKIHELFSQDIAKKSTSLKLSKVLHTFDKKLNQLGKK